MQVPEEVVGVDVLHRDVRVAVGEPEVEALHDVAMADLARQLELQLEALECVGILLHRRGEDLQRDHFVDRLVDRGADVAHRAGTEEALNAVTTSEHRSGDEHLPKCGLALLLELDPLRALRDQFLRHVLGNLGAGGNERRLDDLAAVLDDDRRREQHVVVAGRRRRAARILAPALAAEAVDGTNARPALQARQVVAGPAARQPQIVIH